MPIKDKKKEKKMNLYNINVSVVSLQVDLESFYVQ